MQLTKQILKMMRRRDYAPSTTGEIAADLAKHGFEPQAVESAIDLLLSEGKVIKIDGNRYAAPSTPDLIVGIFEANKAGYGFIEGPSGDLYVPKKLVHGAMNGDTVAVRLQRERRGLSNEAEVIKVINRVHETLIGRVERRGRVAVIVPSDRRIFYEVLIKGRVTEELKEGDMVLARVTSYPNGKLGAEGEILEVLGGEDSPTIEIDVIVREHGLSPEFPPDVLDEALKEPGEVSEEEIATRKDYRDVFTVTIDGLDAKDFDDAVSLSMEGNLFRLGVHIADVSHYVKPGSAIDAEAYRRGTSVYMADRVLPMLPVELSNGICSLNPNVDRLTLSVEMLVDEHGHVKNFDIKKGIIRSDHRLTYEEVDKSFETNSYENEQVKDLLIGLRELSDVLERMRLERGALEFETIEPKVILDEELNPLEVIVREKTPATKLIEEAMILTNEVVASYMYWQEAPMVYRVHDKPSLESLTHIEEFVSTFGYPVKKIKDAEPRTLQKIIAFAHTRPERLVVNHLLLRAMKRAKYYPTCTLHFGLASERYTHFTSPIRRYPDLIVHRLVKAALAGEIFEPQLMEIADALGGICEHTSWMEREAEAAERESVEVKLCQLMSSHVGEIFDATVSGVTNFGVFVELDNTAEGLIHVRDLPGYFEFNERLFELINHKTGRVFRIGQKLRVQLTNVLIGERRMDFALAE